TFPGKNGETLTINWPGSYIHKGQIALLDFISANAESGWKRPLCFSTIAGDDGLTGVSPFLQRRAWVYEFNPQQPDSRIDYRYNIDTEYTDSLLMKVFHYGGIKEKKD